MNHLAILSKKGHWLEKILKGEKTIESRWYKFRRAPFGQIKVGDRIYFKESGEPVAAKAQVKKVLSFAGLNPSKAREILQKYGPALGVGLPRGRKATLRGMDYYLKVRDKKFCVLIFLKNVKRIEPFRINKKGYGMMSAWIIVDDINKIKI